MNNFVQRAINILKSPEGAMVIGVLGLFLAVYQLVFYEPKVELSYAEIVSSDVLGNTAIIPGIEVSFNGQVIDPKNMHMQIKVMKVWNTGVTTFRLNDFDPVQPLTFEIDGAEAIAVTLDDASSDYLKSRLSALLVKNFHVALPPTILEPRDWFTVKFLTVQNSGQTLNIKLSGKVAGVEKLTERIKTPGKVPGSFSYMTAGQLSQERTVAALGLGIASLLAIGAAISSIYRRRKMHFKDSGLPRD